MNPVMRQLLALYPKTWRERYGAELLDLTDDLVAAGDTTPWRAALDLLAGAMKERGRAAFAPAATIIATGSLIAGAVLAIDHRGGLMKPYFDIHPVGYPLLIVVAFWFFVEFINLMRMQERREEALESSGPAERVRGFSAAPARSLRTCGCTSRRR